MQEAVEGLLALPRVGRGVIVAVVARPLRQPRDLDARLAKIDDVGAFEGAGRGRPPPRGIRLGAVASRPAPANEVLKN
jgi:hypothetical protein